MNIVDYLVWVLRLLHEIALTENNKGTEMTVSATRSSNIFALVVAALVGMLLPAGQAQAGLLNTSVAANLNSPNDPNYLTDNSPIDVTNSVTVVGGIEIQAGDGTNDGTHIADFMFTSNDGAGGVVPEYIDFFDTGVILRIAGADQSVSGMTGYSSGAKYVFSGLDSSITGINSILLSSNISNFSNVAQPAGCSAGICFDTHTLTVFLDAMVIGSADNIVPPMGLVTINFESGTTPPPPPLPEPATLLLLGAGLLGMGVSRRKRIRWSP